MNGKILVIGGAGYIGSHVTFELNDQNYNTIIYDDLSSGNKINIDPRSEFVKGSIFDLKLLNNTLQREISTVIHLAALKNAGASMNNPQEYAKHNIAGSLDLMNLCIDNNVKNFIFSSSAAVYGLPKYLPIDEEHTKNPINYYGYTKLCIEENLKWYNKIHGLNIACLRYFNAAGYDIKGRIKGKEKNPANLLPKVMEAIINKNYVSIYGNDYNTKDGTCLRDYIHVNDLAKAHVKSIKALNNHNKIIINLATGKSYSVIEVIKEAEKVSSKKIDFKYTARREGDPENLYSISNKAKTIINWKPEHSDLKTILKSMWKVYT